LLLAIVAATVLVTMSVCAVVIVYIDRQPAWAAASGIIGSFTVLAIAWRQPRAGPST
jgi:hypothetical protein